MSVKSFQINKRKGFFFFFLPVHCLLVYLFDIAMLNYLSELYTAWVVL